jgi:hypothetical protein
LLRRTLFPGLPPPSKATGCCNSQSPSDPGLQAVDPGICTHKKTGDRIPEKRGSARVEMSWITERQASSSGSSRSILVGGAIALSLAGCADAYIAAPSIHPLRHGALSSSSLGHAPRRSPAAGVSLLRSSSQRPSSAGDDTDGSDLLAPIWSASSKIPAKIAGAAAVFSLFLGGSVSVPPEAYAAPSGEPIQVIRRSRTHSCSACIPSRGF